MTELRMDMQFFRFTTLPSDLHNHVPSRWPPTDALVHFTKHQHVERTSQHFVLTGVKGSLWPGELRNICSQADTS